MVFSSLNFLFVFFPAVLLLYFLSPRKLRNLVLLIASLIFYAWGEPVYVVLMIFSILLNYAAGWLVDKHRGTSKAKWALVVSVIVNIALLGFFKYSDFFVQNINALTGLAIPLLHLPLPIGISFYTFQTMSYTIDVYRGDAKMQKNVISFGAYVSLFPQLIAGPIVRYSTIAEQLDCRRETADQFADGIKRFVTGLGKKVLLANNIGMLWTQISGLGADQTTVLGAWIGIAAFTFQIYFDFSGYSDMAIGLGKMFGFTFLENFNYPYISKSVTEFWRRWHISLGTWFREYVYIPLGGNRSGLFKQLRNIAVVWLLTGFWHGASWNFVAWGLYYCVLLVLEKVFLLRVLQRIPAFFSHLYTILAFTVGWVIFAFDSLADGLRYLQTMFGFGGVPFWDNRAVYLLLTNIVMLVILILAATPWPAKIANRLAGRLQGRPIAAAVMENVALAGMLLISVAYLVDSTYNPFLYFRF